MIERIDNSQIQNFLAKSANQTGSTGAVPDEDAQLQVNYASIIEQAQQIPEVDSEAVQRAQQLLLSGQLDNPENVSEAAENIIDFGI